MLSGRFIYDEDITSGRRYAVLGAKEAVELFSNTQCVGETIEIDGFEHTIIGVYINSNKCTISLLQDISRTETYAIYVPIMNEPDSVVMRAMSNRFEYMVAFIESSLVNLDGILIYPVGSRTYITLLVALALLMLSFFIGIASLISMLYSTVKYGLRDKRIHNKICIFAYLIFTVLVFAGIVYILNVYGFGEMWQGASLSSGKRFIHRFFSVYYQNEGIVSPLRIYPRINAIVFAIEGVLLVACGLFLSKNIFCFWR